MTTVTKYIYNKIKRNRSCNTAQNSVNIHKTTKKFEIPIRRITRPCDASARITMIFSCGLVYNLLSGTSGRVFSGF